MAPHHSTRNCIKGCSIRKMEKHCFTASRLLKLTRYIIRAGQPPALLRRPDARVSIEGLPESFPPVLPSQLRNVLVTTDVLVPVPHSGVGAWESRPPCCSEGQSTEFRFARPRLPLHTSGTQIGNVPPTFREPTSFKLSYLSLLHTQTCVYRVSHTDVCTG